MKIGDKVKIKVVSTWMTGTIIDYVEKDNLKWKVKPDDIFFKTHFGLRNRIAKKSQYIYPI